MLEEEVIVQNNEGRIIRNDQGNYYLIKENKVGHSFKLMKESEVLDWIEKEC